MPSQINRRIKALIFQEKIKLVITMTRFLNSSNKAIINTNEDLMKAIIINYSYKERIYETDEENIMISRIKNSEAL